jgi:hypothetical protein
MKFNWLNLKDPKRKQQGQSIVEISLITPLLLIALYIPVDFGISFYVGNMVGNAAREGARIGSGLPKSGNAYTNTQAIQIRDYLRDTVKVPQWLTGRELLISFYDGTGCSQYIDVTVRGNYNFFLYQIINLFGFNVQDSVLISRRTQMRYNYQTAGAPGDSLCTTATSFGPYSI